MNKVPLDISLTILDNIGDDLSKIVYLTFIYNSYGKHIQSEIDDILEKIRLKYNYPKHFYIQVIYMMKDIDKYMIYKKELWENYINFIYIFSDSKLNLDKMKEFISIDIYNKMQIDTLMMLKKYNKKILINELRHKYKSWNNSLTI